MPGSGLIIDGRRELVPGLDVYNWLDNPALRLRKGEDFKRRVDGPDGWVRAVVLHTTKGLPAELGDPPQKILPGFGVPVAAGERVARYWSRDGRQAGAHLVVDFDGVVSCCADLSAEATFHCPGWNMRSIGIELYQGRDTELYEGQLDCVVRLCDFLTRRFGIQRQIPDQYRGPTRRFLDGGGDDAVGVFGHRDAARNRGPGDPGSAVFYRLGLAGYEAFDFQLMEDREVWRRRQREIGMPGPADGIPGPKTVTRLQTLGRPHGMWIERPGDQA